MILRRSTRGACPEGPQSAGRALPDIADLLDLVSDGDADLRKLLEERWARSLEAASSSTAAAWVNGLNAWLEFTAARGVTPVSPPPDEVLAYLDYLQPSYRISTIQSRLWAITRLHVLMLRPSPVLAPEVQAALGRAGAQHGAEPRRAKSLSEADLKAMVAASAGYTGRGFRDRAMLRLSFDAKPTSAQLVAIDVEHIVPLQDGPGMVLLPQKRMGDSPQVRPLQPATMVAITEWASFADITSGALFRAIDRWGTVGLRLKPRQLELCIKRAAEAAGLGTDWSCLSIRGADRGGLDR